VGNHTSDHQSRPPHLGSPPLFPPLGYLTHQGYPSLIPSRFWGREPLQPWEILPTVVPALPSPRSVPVHPLPSRSFPAPFPLVIHPSSRSPALYLALQASLRSSRFVPVAGIPHDSPRLVGWAGGRFGIFGPFFPFIFASLHRRRRRRLTLKISARELLQIAQNRLILLPLLHPCL
jgi:hypothetical protein